MRVLAAKGNHAGTQCVRTANEGNTGSDFFFWVPRTSLSVSFAGVNEAEGLSQVLPLIHITAASQTKTNTQTKTKSSTTCTTTHVQHHTAQHTTAAVAAFTTALQLISTQSAAHTTAARSSSSSSSSSSTESSDSAASAFDLQLVPTGFTPDLDFSSHQDLHTLLAGGVGTAKAIGGTGLTPFLLPTPTPDGLFGTASPSLACLAGLLSSPAIPCAATGDAALLDAHDQDEAHGYGHSHITMGLPPSLDKLISLLQSDGSDGNVQQQLQQLAHDPMHHDTKAGVAAQASLLMHTNPDTADKAGTTVFSSILTGPFSAATSSWSNLPTVPGQHTHAAAAMATTMETTSTTSTTIDTTVGTTVGTAATASTATAKRRRKNHDPRGPTAHPLDGQLLQMFTAEHFQFAPGAWKTLLATMQLTTEESTRAKQLRRRHKCVGYSRKNRQVKRVQAGGSCRTTPVPMPTTTTQGKAARLDITAHHRTAIGRSGGDSSGMATHRHANSSEERGPELEAENERLQEELATLKNRIAAMENKLN